MRHQDFTQIHPLSTRNTFQSKQINSNKIGKFLEIYFRNMFHWLMSYRSDSDIFDPYGESFSPIGQQPLGKYWEKVKTKNNWK